MSTSERRRRLRRERRDLNRSLGGLRGEIEGARPVPSPLREFLTALLPGQELDRVTRQVVDGGMLIDDPFAPLAYTTYPLPGLEAHGPARQEWFGFKPGSLDDFLAEVIRNGGPSPVDVVFRGIQSAALGELVAVPVEGGVLTGPPDAVAREMDRRASEEHRDGDR